MSAPGRVDGKSADTQREPVAVGAVIDVAVSVVRDGSGRVLLAERTARQLSAGFWELPGGKINGGETAAQAAARELREEIGIDAEQLAPWIVYEHPFPTRRVRLNFFRADRWRGQPRGREGQRLAWVDPTAPAVGPVLPSNARALALLALPPLLAITRASDRAGPLSFLVHELPALIAGGVRLLQVREARLSAAQQVQFARRVVERARPHGARVMFAGTAMECLQAGAAGMHSTAVQLHALTARPPAALWSASCHGIGDVQRAEQLGADFVIVSPVRATAAHEGASPLGWDGVAGIVESARLAVYAQGGVDRADLMRAQRCGAVGIALNAAALAAAGNGSQAAR